MLRGNACLYLKGQSSFRIRALEDDLLCVGSFPSESPRLRVVGTAVAAGVLGVCCGGRVFTDCPAHCLEFVNTAGNTPAKRSPSSLLCPLLGRGGTR